MKIQISDNSSMTIIMGLYIIGFCVALCFESIYGNKEPLQPIQQHSQITQQQKTIDSLINVINLKK